MKIIEAINWGVSIFDDKKITNSKNEIEWFLGEILQKSKLDLYLQFNKNIRKNDFIKLQKLINRRINGEPFQHIIGKAPFYGRDFFVNSNVLIPRPETEIIINILKKKTGIKKLLDIGTGSGCLAITCSLENIASSIFATDISQDALSIANKNADFFKIKNIKNFLHDCLNMNFVTSFDVVVSNPPYISINDYYKLQKEIRNYDPKIALTDGDRGLIFYEKFANIFHKIVKNNGYMLLEIGGNIQKKYIENIFSNAKLNTKFFKDLQGDYRVVEVFSI